MNQVPLFEQEQPQIQTPEQPARILSKKEKRIAEIVLEIEKAKLPLEPNEINPYKDYISISPQQENLIYSTLANEELALKDDLSEEGFKDFHVSIQDIRDYLKISNIKIEKRSRPIRKVIRPNLFLIKPPHHPPTLTNKDLASGAKPEDY